jgi:hypothetical protein
VNEFPYEALEETVRRAKRRKKNENKTEKQIDSRRINKNQKKLSYPILRSIW